MRAMMRFLMSILCLSVGLCYAATESVVGTWQTVDSSGTPTSYVKTTVQNGQLTGKITKMLRNAEGVVPTQCTQCTGEEHNQPLVGMRVLWGFTQQGMSWENGQILAPKTGKIYDAAIMPSQNGKMLTITIHAGFFSQTQVWQRVE